jgi:hypothetical protein
MKLEITARTISASSAHLLISWNVMAHPNGTTLQLRMLKKTDLSGIHSDAPGINGNLNKNNT